MTCRNSPIARCYAKSGQLANELRVIATAVRYLPAAIRYLATAIGYLPAATTLFSGPVVGQSSIRRDYGPRMQNIGVVSIGFCEWFLFKGSQWHRPWTWPRAAGAVVRRAVIAFPQAPKRASSELTEDQEAQA